MGYFEANFASDNTLSPHMNLKNIQPPLIPVEEIVSFSLLETYSLILSVPTNLPSSEILGYVINSLIQMYHWDVTPRSARFAYKGNLIATNASIRSCCDDKTPEIDIIFDSDFVSCFTNTPWKLLNISKGELASKVHYLRIILGNPSARRQVLVDALVRSSGSMEKAVAYLRWISSENLG